MLKLSPLDPAGTTPPGSPLNEPLGRLEYQKLSWYSSPAVVLTTCCIALLKFASSSTKLLPSFAVPATSLRNSIWPGDTAVQPGMAE